MSTSSTQTAQRLAVALLQGLALLLLHQSIEFKFWPGESPHWLIGLYSLVLLSPTLFLLSWNDEQPRRRTIAMLLLTLSGVALGYYTGWQANPTEFVRLDTVLAPFILTQIFAALILLTYIDGVCDPEPMSFSILLRRAWRHALTLSFSLLFTLLSWGIFMLWGALFAAIEIDLFMDLFTERWFFYPVLTLLSGVGISLFRAQFRIIDTVIKLVHLMLWILLIPLSFIALIFIAGLLMTGLEPLWESGGSFLILWMQILIILFANVSFQLHDDLKPYPPALQWLVMAALLSMPVYSAISLWGLTLRIEQYGWTVDRLWAIAIWSLCALFVLSYAFAVLRKRTAWFELAARQNLALGLIVALTLLLTQSPLLDFRKLSVQSQLNRLVDADDPTNVLDLSYFRYQLARPGYLALQSLMEDMGDSHPALAARIAGLYRVADQPLEREQFDDLIQPLTDVEPEVMDELYRLYLDDARLMWLDYEYLLQAQMDNDADSEYVLFSQGDNLITVTLLDRLDDDWTVLGPNVVQGFQSEDERLAFIQELKANNWQTQMPQYRDVTIGDVRVEF